MGIQRSLNGLKPGKKFMFNQNKLLHLILLFGAILSSIPSFALAKTLISEKYEYYNVSPNSVGELLNSLRQATPIIQNKKKYFGHTNSQINWSFKWNSEKNICWITSVETKLISTYTLPRLQTKSSDIIRIWNRWYPRLLLHEREHHQRAAEIANEIDQTITNMMYQNSCSELKRKANAIGHNLISVLEKLNIQYDAVTNHGETEGTNILNYF